MKWAGRSELYLREENNDNEHWQPNLYTFGNLEKTKKNDQTNNHKVTWRQRVGEHLIERNDLFIFARYLNERMCKELYAPPENQTHRDQNQQEQPMEQLRVDSETWITNKTMDQIEWRHCHK